MFNIEECFVEGSKREIALFPFSFFTPSSRFRGAHFYLWHPLYLLHIYQPSITLTTHYENQKNNAQLLHFWRVKDPFRRCCYMDLSKLCKPGFVMLLYIIYMYVLFSSKTKQAEFWLRFGSLWKPLLLPLNWIDPGCFKYQLFIMLVCFGHQFLVQQLTTGSQCRYSQILATLCNNVTEFWTKIVDWVTGYRCNFFAI